MAWKKPALLRMFYKDRVASTTSIWLVRGIAAVMLASSLPSATGVWQLLGQLVAVSGATVIGYRLASKPVQDVDLSQETGPNFCKECGEKIGPGTSTCPYCDWSPSAQDADHDLRQH